MYDVIKYLTMKKNMVKTGLTSDLSFRPVADPYVHLDKCTNFDEARLDQRFEIMDESVASICSKFARSK